MSALPGHGALSRDEGIAQRVVRCPRSRDPERRVRCVAPTAPSVLRGDAQRGLEHHRIK